MRKSKQKKTKSILLIMGFSLLLAVLAVGTVRLLLQGEYEITQYIVQIMFAPPALVVIIWNSLVLAGKIKPEKLPKKQIAFVGMSILSAFVCIFMICLFVYALSEKDYKTMAFAAFLAIVTGFGVFFMIKEAFFTKEEIPGDERPLYISQHQQWEHAQAQVMRHKAEYLEDITFIREVKRQSYGVWKQYDILLESLPYGWDMMKDWADYMTQADLQKIEQVCAGAMGLAETNYIKSYQENGEKCAQTPELEREMGMLAISGISLALCAPVKILWFNQTRILRLITPEDDEVLIACYAETMVRRTFGTDSAMKLGKPLPEKAEERKDAVSFENGNIYIDSGAFFAGKKENPQQRQYEKCGIIPLKEKEPVIALYEDGVKTREYCLQTEGEEDFTGKFFQISVRVSFQGKPAIPAVQIDGFISDTDEDRNMQTDDIGYRIEGHFLACGETESALRYQLMRGRDLTAKGLKYPGYTTPANVRLVGICPSCGKSFCFHGYAFYMIQNDVAYSEDGLDCCEIPCQRIDPQSWVYETDGKTFRYYNSFCCPHCGTAYIDYKKYPDQKVFGVSGCVHLGRKHYRAEET